MKKSCGLAMLLLLAVMVLVCTGCLARDDGVETASPSGSAEPSVQSVSAQTPSPQGGTEEEAADLTGFGGLPWGCPLEQAVAEGWEDGTYPVLMRQGAQFAGLTFLATYLFRADPETGTPVLAEGNYIRPSLITVEDGLETGVQAAVADFNQVLEYLTGLYGAPYGCALPTGEITGPLTAEQFLESGGGCTAVWHLDEEIISLELDDSTALTVLFVHG